MKIATAGIIIKDDKVLLARRKHNRFLGLWEFPGGKLEPDETQEECLQRELYEELGVKTIIHGKFFEYECAYPNGSYLMVAFFAKISDGDIKLNVHDKFEFTPIDRLLSYDLAPYDIAIAEELIKYQIPKYST